MDKINRLRDGNCWVINPQRETLTGQDIQGQAKTLAQQANANIVCAQQGNTGVYLALIAGDKKITDDYWDFAFSIKRAYSGYRNLVYIESLDHQREYDALFLCVIIKDYDIYLDEILPEGRMIADINGFLRLFDAADSSTIKFIQSGYVIKQQSEIISAFIQSEDVLNMAEPLTETINISPSSQYVPVDQLRELLRPDGIAKRWAVLLAFIAVAALSWIFLPELLNPPKTEEVFQRDDYAQYRLLMTNGTMPQTAGKLAQVYNHLVAFDHVLRGWAITKVKVAKTGDLIYHTLNHGGSAQELREALKHIGYNFNELMLLDVVKEGTIISVRGQTSAPYTDNNLVMYELRPVFQRLQDAVDMLVPGASVNHEFYDVKDRSQKQWRTMKAQIHLKGAFIDDLLKLRAITNHLPITMLDANLENSGRRISGNISIEIHGLDTW